MAKSRKPGDDESAGKPAPRAAKRLSQAPRVVSALWKLTNLDCAHIDSIYGVSNALKQLHLGEKIDPEDRQFLFDGLASAIAFHELSKLIQLVETTGDNDVFLSDLHNIRIGFALAHRAIDNALDERAIQLEKPIKAALKMHANNAATQEMQQVKKKFMEWQSGVLNFKNDADFARDMTKHFASITNTVSIQNACRKWRKEIKSS